MSNDRKSEKERMSRIGQAKRAFLLNSKLLTSIMLIQHQKRLNQSERMECFFFT